MKILVAARGFDGLSRHQVGNFELDQAKALKAKGHDVRITCSDARSIFRLRPWGARTFSVEGIPVFYCAVPALSKKQKIKAANRISEKLWNQITRDGWKPDIVHAHFSGGGNIVPKARDARIPVVYTEHSSRMNVEKITETLLQSKKKLYAMADRLLCVSNSQAEVIFKRTGFKAQVVPNCIDTGIFSVKEPVEHKDFTFVTACNLVPIKNLNILIDAFAQLCGDVRLVIFGSGPLERELRKQAETLGVSQKIEFRGRQPRETLADEYRKCDCFVMASHRETFGVAIAEALAAGLPAIVSRCGGPEDFVDETNGVVVEADSTPALKDAMQWMTKHSKDFSPLDISKKTTKKYSPSSVAEKLEEIYKGITAC